MLAASPNLTVDQVRDILRTTAQDWGPAGLDVDYGWGRLDGYAAVKKAGNFNTGTAPTVPGHLFFSGTIPAAGGGAEHSFTVTDASYPVAATLIMPGWTGSSSPDFDLYVYNPDGSELGRATGTSRQEQVAKKVTQTGTYKAVVRSYTGTGAYHLDISAGLGGQADQPPAVSFAQPDEGDTLSGTVAVKVRATDDAGVSKVELALDDGAYSDITGRFDGTHYLYDWDTTGSSNGDHTLTARATDSASQRASAARRVTVANQGPPDPGRQHEVTRTGQVSAPARDANVTFTVHEVGYVDLTLAWTTRADLDFYVYAPDGSYVGRAYTLNNPERFRVDTVKWGKGTYTVRVNLYGGPDSSFTLTAKGYQADTFTGTVSPSARDGYHTRPMAYTGRGRVTLSWPGSSDLDVYVYDPSGKERARGYTLNNPELVDVTIDPTGDWRIRTNLYAGSAATYTLRVFAPEAVLS